MNRTSRFFLALACAATLSACGGGNNDGAGSGSTVGSTQPAPTPAPAPVSTYGIAGAVTLAGLNTPLAGVTLTLGSGVTTTTDANGAYAFTGLDAGNYKVTPSMSGISAFSPASLSLSTGGAALQDELFAATSASPVTLGTYHIDPGRVTVAGISSGGAMAVQLQVADAASFHGAAIFAGDPYFCNQNALSTWKSACASGANIPLATLTGYTDNMAANGLIDPTGNLAGKPIYMFSGTADTVVNQAVMDSLNQYYLHYTGSTNIVYDNTRAAQHSWITPDAASDCGYLGTPYMNNCGIDAEQTFLTMFYGPLSARNAIPQGSYVQFNQNAFCSGDCAAISMDSTAWLYVPDNCGAKACKLVVALHGCKQGQSYVGTSFVHQAGINEWADNNNIMVLYPQAIASNQPRNPEGCWDWWGYTGANYALKSAPQMTAIMAMVQRLALPQ